MAQDNAAQSLLDLRSKLGEYARKFLGGDKPLAKRGVVYAGDKPDTSYHDEMVKEANESFRKAAQRKSDPKKLGQRKKSKRSGASRTLGKRAAKRS